MEEEETVEAVYELTVRVGVGDGLPTEEEIIAALVKTNVARADEIEIHRY